MTKTVTQIDHERHMEQVRAVHRRSAYERVLGKISNIERLRAEGEAGLQRPLRDFQLEELSGLYDLRDTIRKEMVEAGQISVTDDAE